MSLAVSGRCIKSRKMKHGRIQTPIRALDLFCGVGGSSFGARSAGVDIACGIDAWELACKTYLDNFPEAKVYSGKCEALDPHLIKRDVGKIQLLLASPECTSHTCAKGSYRGSDDSRNTAFEVVRFAEVMKPRWIVVENVVHMRGWDRYEEWLNRLRQLGYKLKIQILDSAKFRVPQKRRRMFVLCDFESEPPEIRVPRIRKFRPVAHIINPNGKYPFSTLRTETRAIGTVERAERAIKQVGPNGSFLLVYYGTDGCGGWQRLDQPLRTVTTIDRFAYVRPAPGGVHQMRMLQVSELRKAMGFDRRFKLNHGTRRDQIKLLGNAVCPPVMKAIVETLTRCE